jgi:phosphoglycerate kinase
MFSLPLVTDHKDAFKDKRVVLRLDLNVPLDNGAIRDDYRIKESLPTVNFLREAGAKLVIISHIGKGKPEDTLLPVATYLHALYSTVTFLPNLLDPKNVEMAEKMVAGDILLLENLRHSEGEEGNDPEFAKYLASLGEVYVNDAFSVSHRAHASVVGVPALLPHYTGIRLGKEITELARAFDPERPFLFILGGAKISTKMPLLKKFLGVADHVFLGGTIVNDFYKVNGHEIGTSIYDADALVGLEGYAKNPKLIIPSDVVVKNAAGSEGRAVDQVTSSDMIVDVGPDTVKGLETVVGAAKLIVWNGPLGFYEEGFTEGTKELLDLIAGSRATSIIGGGDTVALINDMGAVGKFSFVSTGGGAMLDFLANETLPGIEALQK